MLSMLKAFPEAPIYTSMYEPDRTYPEFQQADVRTSVLDRHWPLTQMQKLAFPFLAPLFSRMHVDADVVLCSLSGWAHGVSTTGIKIVYCHTPARWIYQPHRFVRPNRRWEMRLAFPALRFLRRWDAKAAASAHRYLANSSEVQQRIKHNYGIDATILHPPAGVRTGPMTTPANAPKPGYLLCVVPAWCPTSTSMSWPRCSAINRWSG